MQATERFSLVEVCRMIQQSLEISFPDSFWVIAEISELKENRTGHCYMELVEKGEFDDFPQAKVRATVWSGRYRSLKPFFETSTRRKLTSGLKVLVRCEVNYHLVYGISLNIIDIDPSFTLGDLERIRQETIQRLVYEGIFDMNRQLDFPLLPKRIAIISSPTAAGYEDFTNQLDSNQFGYRIVYKLFAATMQGDNAETSVVSCLDAIFEEIEKWDAVAIIRGGGSQLDLACFDSYLLASNIAQFPIPVITGIGHEKDVTIADLVAHTRLKTPTAAAEFIINQFSNAEGILDELKEDLVNQVESIIATRSLELVSFQSRVVPNTIRAANHVRMQLHELMHNCNEKVVNSIARKSFELDTYYHTVKSAATAKVGTRRQGIDALFHRTSSVVSFKIKQSSQDINSLESNVYSLDPRNVLKRGYSILYKNGKLVRSINNVSKGDEIKTILFDGSIESTVLGVNNSALSDF